MKRYILRLFAILTLSVAFYSCSSSFYVERSEKLREKAIKKGAIYQNDTIYSYITTIDTVLDPITNEITIIKTIIDSIPFEIERLIYVPMTRQERKAYRDSLKYAFKVNRTDKRAYRDSLKYERKINRDKNKVERVKARTQSRSWWKFWLILGGISGMVLLFIVFKYVPFAKKIIL